MESVIGDQAVNSTGNKPNIRERFEMMRFEVTAAEGNSGPFAEEGFTNPSLSGQHANEIMSLVIAKYVR
ncbi:hypothetical protein MT997_11315 [Paenibacillus sp. OVF10]|nr:hypothetical protein MT997_11315 [Paenibacillus sp. OVF10]